MHVLRDLALTNHSAFLAAKWGTSSSSSQWLRCAELDNIAWHELHSSQLLTVSAL